MYLSQRDCGAAFSGCVSWWTAVEGSWVAMATILSATCWPKHGGWQLGPAAISGRQWQESSNGSVGAGGSQAPCSCQGGAVLVPTAAEEEQKHTDTPLSAKREAVIKSSGVSVVALAVLSHPSALGLEREKVASLLP